MAEKGAMTVREVGRRGGTQTKRKYGPGFYKAIGGKGGKTTKRQCGPQLCGKTRATHVERRAREVRCGDEGEGDVSPTGECRRAWDGRRPPAVRREAA